MQNPESLYERHSKAIDGILHPPDELPDHLPARALFLLVSNYYLTGVIGENHKPCIYDVCKGSYLRRENWDGIIAWMRLPE